MVACIKLNAMIQVWALAVELREHRHGCPERSRRSILTISGAFASEAVESLKLAGDGVAIYLHLSEADCLKQYGRCSEAWNQHI